MFQFALIGDGDGFESLVGMRADSPTFISWREKMRRSVVEHEKGAQFLTESVVVENGADGESIADPMHGGSAVNALKRFHGGEGGAEGSFQRDLTGWTFHIPAAVASSIREDASPSSALKRSGSSILRILNPKW